MGRLIRVPGLSGYFSAEDLNRPCGTCGGTEFWAYRWGLRCVRCVPQNRRKPERSLGIVDIARLELGLQREGEIHGE